MPTGVVISFDDRHGLGFIRSRRFGEDVFVHACAIDDGRVLRPGERVRFEASASRNGLRAVRVRSRPRVLAPWAVVAILALVVLAGLTAARALAGWPWPWSWLAGVNLAALVALGLDRRRALLGVPPLADRLDLTLALLGGSPTALLARPRAGRASVTRALAAIGLLHLLALALALASGLPPTP
jgi:CspA family cold shock protein